MRVRVNAADITEDFHLILTRESAFFGRRRQRRPMWRWHPARPGEDGHWVIGRTVVRGAGKRRRRAAGRRVRGLTMARICRLSLPRGRWRGISAECARLRAAARGDGGGA